VQCGEVSTCRQNDERHQDESRRESQCGISDPV
jgi:hypothetical protein